MTDIARDDRPLSPLRDDLEISLGAPFLNGAPGWVIHDPVRHKFFQIGQRAIDVLSSWSAGTVGHLKSKLIREKAIQVDDTEIDALLNFLRQNQLLESDSTGTAKHYANLVNKNPLQKFWFGVQKMLFVRIPLFRPEPFLKATWPLVKPLFSKTFIAISAAVLLFSLYLAGRQLADIEAHLRQAFTWGGAVVLIAAIAFVKMLHELGHAYQATARGLRVPVMGVAFFAFLPLLYTDITDAWRLRRRRDRVLVDLGGILVELTIAVYATLAWCFLPDGSSRTIAFAIASSSWVLSLFVNLNPFMRFDGYYLLSDSLGIQNLQNRSFALAKWAMRSVLFGLDDPAPEALGGTTRRGMIAYAYGVWVYRLFLFMAIALLLYSMFFKLAGIALLAVSVSAFIVKPVVTEVLFWVRSRDRIRRSRRSLVTLSCMLVLLLLFFWPMSARIQVPAVLEEARQQAIFPPDAYRLVDIFVEEGHDVMQGDPLFQFSDPELPVRINQAETRIAMLKARQLSAAGDSRERAEGAVIARMLDEELENLSALKDRQESLLVTAAMDGQIRELSTDLDTGVWYPRTHLMGRIIQSGSPVVRGYVSEANLERLDPTKTAKFIADEIMVPVVAVDGLEVSGFSVEKLADGYLAHPNGGSIAVSTSDPKTLVVAEVWYPLSGRPSPDILPSRLMGQTVHRGVILTQSKPESVARRIGRRIARVLVREVEF